MPINPALTHLYPGGSIRSAEWRAIRVDVLKRTRHRCQTCGVPDRTVLFVFRDDGAPIDRRTMDFWGHRHAPTQVALVTIFLSVAHLDHDPANNRARNLKALCQGCHLRHDREHHWRTRRSRNAIGDLFEGVAA